MLRHDLQVRAHPMIRDIIDRARVLFADYDALPLHVVIDDPIRVNRVNDVGVGIVHPGESSPRTSPPALQWGPTIHIELFATRSGSSNPPKEQRLGTIAVDVDVRDLEKHRGTPDRLILAQIRAREALAAHVADLVGAPANS